MTRWRPAAVLVATLAVALLALLVALPAVHASPAAAPPPEPGSSAGEVRQLAAQAVHDPAALARLRDVRVVDGRSVDLGAALATDVPAELDARLRALAGGATGATGTPEPAGGSGAAEQARRDASSVLAQSRYHRHEPPRPLRGVLRWIGSGLEWVFGPVGRFFVRLVPNGWRLPLLGLLLAALAALLAWYFVRRRSHASVERHRRLAGLVQEAADPRELERRADLAEGAGRYGEAVRLRFLAGLVRLDRAGVVEVRTSETTGQLRAALRSPSFDSLAVTFDEVVYGNRTATAADVAAARAGWSRVLQRRPEPVGSPR